MKTAVGMVASLGAAAFTAWIFWGPLRGFLFSLIPATAEYAWVGKLLIIGFIGWGGGIALPLVILVGGFALTLKVS